MEDIVEISENMCLSSQNTFKISKLLGLAPYCIRYTDRKYKISLSKHFLVVSFLFGLLLVALTIMGIIHDLKAGTSSLKMTSTKSAIITFCDVFFIIFIIVLGIFGTPFRLKTFWKLVTLIYEVDKLIKTNDGKEVNKNQSIKLLIILILVPVLLLYTMVVEDRTADGYFSVKNYIVFYFLYIIVYIIEFNYWHIVQAIGRRFKRLNECLEMGKNNNKLIGSNNEDKLKSLFTIQLGDIQNYPRDKQLKVVFGNIIRQRSIDDFSNFNVKNGFQCSAVEFISKLSEAHGKLFEAVNIINDTFGFLSLVIIMSCLFHLVVTPYFLLVDLLIETSSLIPNLVMQFLWVVAHVCRLLIIIEPCYATCDEAKKTNPLVAKMLCTNLDDYYKKQLQMFSLQLVHRQIEFSAFGLCSIDRPLLSAIAGAITTYLVILLQFR